MDIQRSPEGVDPELATPDETEKFEVTQPTEDFQQTEEDGGTVRGFKSRHVQMVAIGTCRARVLAN